MTDAMKIDIGGNLIPMTANDIASLPKPEDAPAPPPLQISDRQFAVQLKAMNLISHEEALAFVARGVMPAPLMALVRGIPDQAAREAAEIDLAGATTFHRDHPLTQALGLGFGWKPDHIDDFFRAAAAR